MSDINSSSETGARTRSSWNFASVDILHSYIIGACLSAFPAIRLSKLGRQDKSLAIRPGYMVGIIESFREWPNTPCQPFRGERQ
jgi:hypothetical protein